MTDQLPAILTRLIRARELAGLSQGQVASLLGLSGTAATVSQWEHGEGGLTLARFLQLCDLYHVNSAWVLTGINPGLNTEQAYNLTVGIATDARKLWEVLSAVSTSEHRVILDEDGGL